MHIYNKKSQQSCDFAAIDKQESFSKKCDVVLERNDGIKTDAQVFAESWEKIIIGQKKKGAKPDVTKCIIFSPEWFEKVMDDNNRQCFFLVT